MSSNSSVTTRYFRGRAFTIPGAYSAGEDSGGSITPPLGTSFPLLIGSSQGGVPNKVLTYTSPQEAQNELIGGPLLDGVKRAFSPFADSSAESDLSPFLVRAIRIGDGSLVNGPRQGTLSLLNNATPVPEIQTVTLTGATFTAGTFTLTFGGQTTSALAYNAAASVVQTALQALSSIGSGNATVSGSAGGPYTVTFAGTLGTGPQSLITGNGASLTPTGTVAVVETQEGTLGASAITLNSLDYGAYVNGMRITVDAPSLSNPNKFGYRVRFQRDNVGGVSAIDETFDNIGRYGIDIYYVGAGTTVTLTVDATHLATTTSVGGAENLNIPFATYTTLGQVVDQINRTGVYGASVADVLDERPSNTMDWITGASITGPMTVHYTGAGSAAVMGVETSEFGNLLNINVTGATADNISLLLKDSLYPTLGQLALAIAGITDNGDGTYTGGTVASSGSGVSMVTTYTGSVYTIVLKNHFASLPVDTVLVSADGTDDYVDVKTSATLLNGAFTTTQNSQAIIDHLQEYYGTLFSVTVPSTVSVGQYPIRTSATPYYFHGGEDALENRDGWSKALLTAQDAEAQIVTVLTPDPFVHAALKVHCAVMSDPTNRRERVGIVGGAAGESVLDAVNRAATLGSLQDGELVQLVYPGISDIDFDGSVLQIPPYMLAAQMAGASAALPLGNAKTNKFIRATGVEKKLTRLDLANLIIGGVTPIENIETGLRRGFRVTKDISTWKATPNFIKHLFATQIAAQAIRRIVRERCEELVGQPNTKNFQQRVTERVKTTLGDLESIGVLVAGQNDPAWKNVVVKREVDTVRIDFEANVVTEVSFIFITARLSVQRNN